jgi:hypothetical protein
VSAYSTIIPWSADQIRRAPENACR